MFSRSKKKNDKPKKKIITLDDGWKTITEGGLEQFLVRVEGCDDAELQTPNPASEMVKITDIVFTMATQREPHDCSEGLYLRTQERLHKYFSNECLSSLRDARTNSHLKFCHEWGKRWRQCVYAVNGMRRMFDRLNKYYVPSNDKLNLTEMGFTAFKEVCYEESRVDLKDSILHFFESDRNGQTIDRTVVKNCVQLYIRLGQSLETESKEKHGNDDLFLYKKHLETPLLTATRHYYDVESRKWLQQMSIPEYLAKVEEVFQAEMERVNSMLHPPTSTPTVLAVLRETLLRNHLPVVIEDTVSGFNVILAEDGADDLSRLYRLYKDVDGTIDVVAKEFNSHISSLGFGAVERAKSEEKTQKNLKLITNIIHLHDRFHTICMQSFQGDHILTKALRNAFENFINATHYVTRYLAKYTHQFMMKGGTSEGLEEAEKLDIMKHIQKIYGYIRDKDVFEREFQLYLAARLLSNKSASNAMEGEMIGLLKAQSGYFWAEKLEQMFKDISVSKEIVRDFKKYLQKKNFRDRAKSLPAISKADTEEMKNLPTTSLQRNLSTQSKKVYLQSTRKQDRVHEVQNDNFRIKYLQSVNVVKKTPVEEHLGETRIGSRIYPHSYHKEEITIPIANQKPRENFDFHSSSGGSPKNTSVFNYYNDLHRTNYLHPTNDEPSINPPSDSEHCIFELD